ncbi:MAG TPA: hypothetical protein VNM14_09220 [Planctomycetota bacterium]|jgi:hypothetical protein|nr:hypothetical protein [Planctomycetota bacterium]
MSKRGSGNETFWLWDGEAEYQGHLLAVDGQRLTARLREIRRWTLDSGAPGKPVPLNLIERQRHMCRRVCFGQSPALHMGGLLEFRVGAVQPSKDHQYDYVLSGTFASIDDDRLEALSQLSSAQAHRYLQGERGAESATGT